MVSVSPSCIKDATVTYSNQEIKICMEGSDGENESTLSKKKISNDSKLKKILDSQQMHNRQADIKSLGYLY